MKSWLIGLAVGCLLTNGIHVADNLQMMANRELKDETNEVLVIGGECDEEIHDMIESWGPRIRQLEDINDGTIWIYDTYTGIIFECDGSKEDFN